MVSGGIIQYFGRYIINPETSILKKEGKWVSL